MAMQDKLNDYQQGIFYAAGLLVEFMDQPTYAADILQEAGLLDADVSELDETEQRAMKKLSMVTAESSLPVSRFR